MLLVVVHQIILSERGREGEKRWGRGRGRGRDINRSQNSKG